MILSRWIKKLRLETEVGNSAEYLDFGLGSNQGGNPISFVKYKFNSNDESASMFKWLSKEGFEDTQYIGFFNIEAIKSWLNFEPLIDRIISFSRSNNFFIFNLNEVFSLNMSSQPQDIRIKYLDKPDINSSVIREENVLKLFTPPDYPTYLEDKRVLKKESNPGEIDIVAYNMGVYGILCDHPSSLFLSRRFPNNIILTSYSDYNVTLINEVLNRMKIESFIDNDYSNLLNNSELNTKFKNELNEQYLNTLEQTLNNLTDYQRNKIKDISTNINIITNKVFIINGESIKLNKEIDNTKFYNKILEELRIIVRPNFNIDNYKNEHFCETLLLIASFLNNYTTRTKTIEIFRQVKELAPLIEEQLKQERLRLEQERIQQERLRQERIQQERLRLRQEQQQREQREQQEQEQLKKQRKDRNGGNSSKHKYLKYKTKYLELKKKQHTD
jgi:hypothetical protein